MPLMLNPNALLQGCFTLSYYTRNPQISTRFMAIDPISYYPSNSLSYLSELTVGNSSIFWIAVS